MFKGDTYLDSALSESEPNDVEVVARITWREVLERLAGHRTKGLQSCSIHPLNSTCET